MAEPAFTYPLHFIPSAAVMAIQDGEVYLHFRENTGTLKGYWAMPGGKFELDDRGVPQTAVEAAVDEFWQEARIRVEPSDLFPLFTVPEPSEKGIFLCHVFLTHLDKGEVMHNSEPDKHGIYTRKSVQAWLYEDEKPLPGSKGLLPATRAALKYLLAHPELLKAPVKAGGTGWE